MADITQKPPVKTPQPQREDLSRLIPDNVRLVRALEQLMNDVRTVLPDAVQQVGEAAQQALDESNQAANASINREIERKISGFFDLIDRANDPANRKLKRRLEDLEKIVYDFRQPVKPRVERFIAPSFSNSWANFGSGRNNAGYYKDPFGIIHLRGVIASGTINTSAFTLPAGYRPAASELMVAISNSAIGYADINTDGTVVPVQGSNVWFSLDGMTFRAA